MEFLPSAFADGNHDPAWVENDFHDYGGDLPQVTATLDRMLREYAEEVVSIETLPERWLLLVHKRSDHRGFCQVRR